VEHRRLGCSDVEVSVVGLDAWQVLDVRGCEREEERHKVVQSALESGIGLFDSSPIYSETS
jgi:aryl-alcohol dehydrogenase-like predicted oxidoreductase